MISPLGVDANGNELSLQTDSLETHAGGWSKGNGKRGMRLATDTFGVCKFTSGIKPDLAVWPDRTEVRDGRYAQRD